MFKVDLPHYLNLLDGVRTRVVRIILMAQKRYFDSVAEATFKQLHTKDV